MSKPNAEQQKLYVYIAKDCVNMLGEVLIFAEIVWLKRPRVKIVWQRGKWRLFLAVLVWLWLYVPCQASEHLHKERYYQNLICNVFNGQTEYVLPDHTRIDCLTSEYAIEVDFGYKWAESIGQSLFYAQQTGKRPGIVLILEHPKRDITFWYRFNKVSTKYGITVWAVFVEKGGDF